MHGGKPFDRYLSFNTEEVSAGNKHAEVCFKNILEIPVDAIYLLMGEFCFQPVYHIDRNLEGDLFAIIFRGNGKFFFVYTDYWAGKKLGKDGISEIGLMAQEYRISIQAVKVLPDIGLSGHTKGISR